MNPGTRLDQYEIVDKIGEGGMGAVYKARDTSLDRDVAVKVLPPSFTADAGRVARFEREAKALAALSHPNIVGIYGFGTCEGVTYAAMELLEGMSLREHLDEGPLPLRKAVDIARQMATGLDAAHAGGIVHRDLKPDNVFITPDGRARILDFGLASDNETGLSGSSDDSGTRTRLTNPGTIVGTVGYMSPEQARGTEAGPAADLFALGVMLHEMLSGKHPFDRETTAETLTAILREEPPEPTVGSSSAPAALARVVRRCLEKSPEERFRSANDLAFALESSIADSGASQPAIPASAKATQSSRSRSGIVVATAVALLAFGAGWWLRPEPPTVEPPRVKELTFTGQDSQPAVSPDDRLIAFRSTRGGVSRIWLRRVDGGGEQPLTEGSDFRPGFSGDSQWVTFVRRDADLYSAYRVSVLGGQQRKLIEDVLEVAWSPDGRNLAFLRGNRSADAGVMLGVMDLESRQERVLTSVEGRNLLGVSWSDDSQRIATTKAGTQGASGDFRLLVADITTDDVQEIDLSGNVQLSSPIWAGNDAVIYAEASTAVSGTPEPMRIVRYDLTREQGRTLLWEPYLFSLAGVRSPGASISILGGDRLIFETFRQVQTIQELDAEDGALRTLSAAVSSDRQPSYSPDGTKALFTSNRSGNVDLFAHEFATGQLVQLTDHAASDWDGAYTPDGESILWSSDRGGSLEIWIADADGANPRQLTNHGANAENPTMTADGEWVIYSNGDPNATGLYKVRPDGTDATLLIAGNWTNPEVSHDGRFALFIENDAAGLVNTLGVVEVATGEIVDFQIAVEYSPESPNVAYGRGRWMPGDEAIAFVGVDSDGETTLLIQDFIPGQDTTASRRKPLGADAAGVVESFGVSPDGKRFALASLRIVHVLKMAEGLDPLH